MVNDSFHLKRLLDDFNYRGGALAEGTSAAPTACERLLCSLNVISHLNRLEPIGRCAESIHIPLQPT